MHLQILRVYILLIVILCVGELNGIPSNTTDEEPQLLIDYPCKNNKDIVSIYFKGVHKGYTVTIMKDLQLLTSIKVKLDSSASISFGDDFENPSNDARMVQSDRVNNIFYFFLRKDVPHFSFIVKGRHAPEHPPYIISLKIDEEENCVNPDRTYFAKHQNEIKELWSAAPDKFCGRRRYSHEYTPLMVGGTTSKAGHWPWHVALYKKQDMTTKYICGGTLISKLTVLTAAHCVTEKGVPVNPGRLKVIIGITSLNGNEPGQHREIFAVNVHEDYSTMNFDNDIALLKLSSEVEFNNFIQPACLWTDDVFDQLASYEVTGTVVGWGIDLSDSIVNDLQQLTIPIATKLTCLEYNTIFYGSMLNNNKKFCAGNANGKSPCNGDSGGGYSVFVPDTRDPAYHVEYKTGAWYIRGIVSVGLTKDSFVCEPKAYTIFTDVSKYRDWILNHIS